MFRIFLAGSDKFSLPPFRAIRKASDFKIVGILTTPDKPKGRGRKIEPGPVAQFAKKYKLPLFQPEKLKEFTQTLVSLKPELAFLAAFGRIIPPVLLKIPKKGWLNLHPSYLPKLRGPNPIGGAVLKNKGAGLTLIQMTPEIDGGSILFREKIPILKDETTAELKDRLAQKASRLIVPLLKKELEGKLKPLPQKGKTTYAGKFNPEDAQLDFQKDSLEVLDRKIRAFNPEPKAHLFIDGKRLILLKSRFDKDSNKLIILELQVEGKKPITGSQFLMGYSHWLTKFPSFVKFE